jgi:hypothetical protein
MFHIDLSTVLGSMAVTAVLGALPKPGAQWSWGLVYKVFYDALTGFWSLKTGAKIPDAFPAGSHMSEVATSTLIKSTDPAPGEVLVPKQ